MSKHRLPEDGAKPEWRPGGLRRAGSEVKTREWMEVRERLSVVYRGKDAASREPGLSLIHI